jgi:hypothetical protein
MLMGGAFCAAAAGAIKRRESRRIGSGRMLAYVR